MALNNIKIDKQIIKAFDTNLLIGEKIMLSLY